MTLKVRPGLSAPLVNSIPADWDAQWFRRWITDFLNTVQIASGVTSVAVTAGLSISPASGTGAVTISIGASGIITSVVGTANQIAVSTTGTVATLSLPPNVVITTTIPGYSLVASTTVSGGGIQIVSPGGSANTLGSGGVLSISNNVNFGTLLQNSGGQTELWQFNGVWNQVLFVDTNAEVNFKFSMVWANNVWNRSAEGSNRFYCAVSGVTYFGTGSAAGWHWQNAGGTDISTLDGSGNLALGGTLALAGAIVRASNVSGYLFGNYPFPESGTQAGCIYAIGTSYQPNNGTTNALGTLYGVGFTTSSTTMGNGTTIAAHLNVPAGNWGFYASSSGVAGIFLNSDNASIYAGNAFLNGIICAGINVASVAGDISANRGGSGAIFLGTTSNYLFFSGSVYSFGGTNQVQAGSFDSTSDERWKDEITLIPNALDKVSKLRGATWVWNSKAESRAGKRGAGLIAQDVEKVLGEAVSDGGIGANGEPSHKVLNYAATNGLLVEAIKELKARVELLEAA